VGIGYAGRFKRILRKLQSMKTAIFVVGEYRQFEQAAPFWDDVYSKYNPDYYFSMWDYSREVSKYNHIPGEMHFDIEKNVTESMILKYFPDATISLHHEDKKKWSERISSKIWFTLKKCAEMCKNSGEVYDLIIIKRADSIEDFEYNLFDNLQSNTIYTKYGTRFNEDTTIQYDFYDSLWYGQSETVIRFINKFCETEYYKMGVNCHNDPDEFLHEAGFKSKSFISFQHLIIRPNMIHMFDTHVPVIDFLRKNNLEISYTVDKWYGDLRKPNDVVN